MIHEKERCEDCKYFNTNDFGNGGTCRRYPPIDSSVNNVVFPFVRETTWCGEYRVMK